MPRNPDNTRLKEMAVEDLLELSRRLRKASSAIQSLAKALDKQDHDTIEVEGHKMLERAFESISKFVGNCQKQIREF